MSSFMKAFSNHFMDGMKLGAGWAEKWQAQKLAEARNKIMAERYAAQDRRENAKFGLHAQKVANDIKVGDARAFRLMNPVARGGGGKGAAGAAGPDPAADELRREAAGLGIIGTYAPPAAQGGNTTIYQGSDASETDAMSGSTGDSTYTDSTVEVPGAARGGMIRKMAGGGSIEEGANMGIEEAMSYGKKPKPDAAGALGSALGKAVADYKPKDTIVNAAPAGSGEIYNRGGAVRTFQSGGRVLREPTAIDTGMSGPGSGYGQRASPPAGARRY